MESIVERHFEAMGTQVHVVVRGQDPKPLLSRAWYAHQRARAPLEPVPA